MLERRIPPPVVGLLVAIAMWFARDLGPALPVPGAVHAPLATLLGPAAFVAWITRFQIYPEEKILAAKLGEAFAAYRARVRQRL